MSQTEESTIAGEHAVQISMIDLLRRSIKEGKSIDEKTAILDQLISYTEVHFMSEQLIMRQHSYEGYDEHDGEHDILMEQLLTINNQVLSNETRLEIKLLRELRELLLTHIATHDKKLANYLASTEN
ncbi:bacteriohemerythrin [Sedimenticola selenatireducens]|nr:hemerythrin family protein [Sedimenticola selenatireducens]